jgi:hypothetical protein
MKRSWPLLIWFLLTAAPLLAGAVRVEEPPAVGRPADFSGLVGSYDITATAAPTTLFAEDPLLLTVRITGSGPSAFPPHRDRLHLFPSEMAKDFYIKSLPDRYRRLAAQKTWELAYELRPKRAGIKKIPALRLVYYDPTYRRYQKSYARSIALLVKPRPQVQPPADTGPVLPVPESLYELSTGPEVLRRQGHGWPGWMTLVLFLAVPPLLAGLGYAWWRHRHPDAVRLARQRRSQAAERALKALDQSLAAGQVARLFAGYLSQRLDLPTEEPTPREAIRHLRRQGVPRPLARRAADLLRACDAARFAPTLPASDGLASEAARLILDLEAELCSSSRA